MRMDHILKLFAISSGTSVRKIQDRPAILYDPQKLKAGLLTESGCVAILIAAPMAITEH